MKNSLLILLVLILFTSCQQSEETLIPKSQESPEESRQNEAYRLLTFESDQEIMDYINSNPSYTNEDKAIISAQLNNENLDNFRTGKETDGSGTKACEGCSLTVYPNVLSGNKYFLAIKTPDNIWVSGAPIAIGYDVMFYTEEWSNGFSSSKIIPSCSYSKAIYEPYAVPCISHAVSFYVHNTNSGFIGNWNFYGWENFPNINSQYNCTHSKVYLYRGPSSPDCLDQ